MSVSQDEELQKLRVDFAILVQRVDGLKEAVKVAEQKAEKAEIQVQRGFGRVVSIGGLGVIVTALLFYWFIIPQNVDQRIIPVINQRIDDVVAKHNWEADLRTVVNAQAEKLFTPEKIAAAIERDNLLANVKVREGDVQSATNIVFAQHPDLLTKGIESAIASAVDKKLQQTWADSKIIEDGFQAVMQRKREEFARSAMALHSVQVDSIDEFVNARVSTLDPEGINCLVLYPCKAEPVNVFASIIYEGGHTYVYLKCQHIHSATVETRDRLAQFLKHRPNDEEVCMVEASYLSRAEFPNRDEACKRVQPYLASLLAQGFGVKTPTSLKVQTGRGDGYSGIKN